MSVRFGYLVIFFVEVEVFDFKLFFFCGFGAEFNFYYLKGIVI